MSDKKEYTIVGKVEIGSDEFRDLIEDKAKAEREADDYRSKYWSEQNKVKSLEEKLALMEQSLDHYRKFVDSKEDISLEYKMYLRQIGE